MSMRVSKCVCMYSFRNFNVFSNKKAVGHGGGCIL